MGCGRCDPGAPLCALAWTLGEADATNASEQKPVNYNSVTKKLNSSHHFEYIRVSTPRACTTQTDHKFKANSLLLVNLYCVSDVEALLNGAWVSRRFAGHDGIGLVSKQNGVLHI